MKINNECCCGCKTEKPDQIKDNCPVCNNEGISVRIMKGFPLVK